MQACKTCNLTSECVNGAYHALLEFVSRYASSFYLVDQWRLGEGCNAVLERLAPFLLREETTHQWPGTTLHGGFAVVRHYANTPRSIAVLKDACTGLYAWRYWPTRRLPEDLGFLRADGSMLLASIAHERDSWLQLSADEFDSFERLAHAVGLAYALEG